MSNSDNPLRMSLYGGSNIIYNHQFSFSIDLAIWIRRGKLSGPPKFEFEVDGKSVTFSEKRISRFDPPKLKRKDHLNKPDWSFRRLTTTSQIGAGWHVLTVKVLDDSGNRFSQLKVRGLIEPFAPEVSEKTGTSQEGNFKVLSFEVATRQLPEIMQLPLTALSEIGQKIASRFQAGGINRIYDLLTVDSRSLSITDVHPLDVPDAVTKAKVLQDLTWNSSSKSTLSHYSLNQLSLFSTAEIAEFHKTDLRRASRLLERIKRVHMVLDRSLQDDRTLTDFISHRHSGVASVRALLNQQDVSDQLVADKDIYSFNFQELDEGQYWFELEFLFNSGNKRTVSRTFTIDNSGPVISLKSPQQKFIKNEDLVVDVELRDEWTEVDRSSVQLWVDEQQVSEEPSFTSNGFTYRVPSISEGEHLIWVKAADTFGNGSTSETWNIVVDRKPPLVQIDEPVSPYFSSNEFVWIAGKVIDSNIEDVRIGDQLIQIDSDGSFRSQVQVTGERDELIVEARDKAGNVSYSNTVKVFHLSDEQAGVIGVVLAASKAPLQGIKVTEPKTGKTTWTNGAGEYLLMDVPEGRLTLTFTALPEQEILYDVVPIKTSYGQITNAGTTCLLDKGLPAQKVSTTNGQLLKSKEHEGFELFIANESSIVFPNAEEEPITMSLVNSELLSGKLPSGIPKCRAAVFGPSGLRIEAGAPMQVTLPNDLSLPKGEKLLLITIDGATGGLSAAGVAEVSEDEMTIVSQEGHGLTHFSVVLPMPTNAQIEPYREDKEVGLDDALKGGSQVQIDLPGFMLLNRAFQPRLTYSSLAAAPTVHMTATFRGMKEITTSSRVIDHVHIQKEASVKRVEYFADYSLWLKEFRDHNGTDYFNEKYSDSRFHFVTYLPADATAPVLPVPESLFHGGTFGPKFHWVLDRLRQQEWTIKLYEVDMSLSVTERVAVWPESITGRYLFSDLDTGPFTLHGPLTPIGQIPHPGEEDTRESFPRLPVDTLLSYHIDPRLPDGSFYPTGLYSWLGNFNIKGRGYSQIQSSQTARKGAFNHDGIKWMLENTEGQKRAELEKLVGVLEKARGLHDNGPIYQSKYSYSDPLDYLVNEQAGQTIIHNLANSAFGAGWKLEEQHELIPVGRNQVLTIGPEGKQVFTVDNKIQQVRLAYLDKMTYSHDGRKLYAISRAGTDWIVDQPSLSGGSFTGLVQTIVGSRAFAIKNPAKEEFVTVLYETLMGHSLSEVALEQWLQRDVFRYDMTPQGVWHSYSIFQFIYSEEHLRLLISHQYQTALDRDPTDAEFLKHQNEVASLLANTLRANFDSELHAERLMTIIADLFFELRHEMNIHDGFDWYIYIWTRVYGVEPTMQELSPMINGIARYGKNTPDTSVRKSLYYWLLSTYWSLKMDPLYERLLGFPRYRDHGLRVYEQGEERAMNFVFPKVGKYLVTTRYRSYRHPTSNNPDVLFLGSQVIETSPRELYNDGPTHTTIKGMAEKKDGALFLSDANANHIYMLVDDTQKLPDHLKVHHSSGALYLASVFGRSNAYLPFEPIDYYDENGNLINLPEEEAKWASAYMEFSQTRFVTGIPSIKGFTPDGQILDKQGTSDALIDAPGGLALDHEDRLCFAETGNNRVRRIDLESGELVTLAGNGEASGYDPTAIDPLKTAIPEPIEIVISERRELFILFHIGLGQQCIGKIDRAGFYQHIAGAPVPGTGTLDTGGDARFFKLLGGTSMALSPTGELFIALTNQHRVMVITPDGFIDTAAGNGESGLPKNGGPALQASLGKPVSIACDRNGNLLINDQLNKSLRMVNLALCEYDSETYFRPPLGYFEASLVQHRNGTWSKHYKNGSCIHFDHQGRHTQTTDRNGNGTYYHFEEDRLKEVSYPAGGKLEFFYDDKGKLQRIKDHVGRETSIQVINGRLASLENAENIHWQFTYDPDGRILRLDQGESSQISYTYNDYGRLIAQNTNGKLTQIERPDDLAAGNLDQENQEALIAFQNQTRITSTEGNESSFKLEHGRLTELVSTSGGAIEVQYNLDGLPEVVTRPSGSQLIYTYNRFGDQVRFQDTFTGSVIESTYDDDGRKLEESNEIGIKSVFEYDEQGNLVRSHLVHGENVQQLFSQSFDPRGLMLERHKKGVSSSYQYDEQGNLIREHRGILMTEFQRDEAGNILREEKGEISREFEYDRLNQLTAATEGEGQTNYSYDNHGNLIQITAPNGAMQKLVYDGRNRMTEFENPNGKLWKFGFDWDDRLIQVTYPDGKELNRIWNSTTEVAESYNGKESTMTYFEKSSERSGINHNGGFIYEFDEAGRKVSQIQFFEHTSYKVIHQVDSMDRSVKLLSPGQEVVYAYGDFGRLKSMHCGNWELNFFYEETSGRLSSLGRNNSVETRLAYDPSGLVDRIEDYRTGSEIGITQIGFSEAGFPVRIETSSDKLDITYDARGQLTGVLGEGIERNYAYDSIGNRIVGPEGNYAYDPTGQLLLSCPRFDYQWDELGRLMEKVDRDTQIRHSYGYQANGQMVTYQRYDQEEIPLVDAHYGYDTMGRRVHKIVQFRDDPEKNIHRKWIYNGPNLLLELNEEEDIMRQYLCGADSDSWLGFLQSDKAYYFQKDQMGSITAIIDDSGVSVVTYSYDEFGVLTESDSSFPNEITYTGREYDQESGLYYYRMRHYDPTLGRFIQPDGYLGSAKEPKSMINRYIYVHNNPFTYRDPSGLSPQEALSSVGDAALWVVDVIWEIIKWLFSGSGEILPSMEGGPTGTYRDSFDVMRANNSITEGYWEAGRWLGELMDQSIGKVLRELWGVISNLFDWSTPDFELPSIEEFTGPDLVQLNSFAQNGFSPIGSLGSGTERAIGLPHIPGKLRIFPHRVFFATSNQIDSFSGFLLNQKEFPNYLIPSYPVFRDKYSVLLIKASTEVDSVDVFFGNVQVPAIIPGKLVIFFTENGIDNPIFNPDGDRYWYFDIGKNVQGNWNCNYTTATTSSGSLKCTIRWSN